MVTGLYVGTFSFQELPGDTGFSQRSVSSGICSLVNGPSWLRGEFFQFVRIVFGYNAANVVSMFIFLRACTYRLLLTSRWFHVIVLLIFLEIFILLIFIFASLSRLILRASGGFIFVFITLRVAEARIGIAVLTMLVRRHGNDFIRVSIF